MEFDLTRFAESLDLRAFHWIASYVGIFLCVGAIQVWRTVGAESGGNWISVAVLRRAGLAVTALAFIWSIYYAMGHPKWQPWPPDCAMLLGVDLYLLAVIAGSYVKWYSEHRSPHRTVSG